MAQARAQRAAYGVLFLCCAARNVAHAEPTTADCLAAYERSIALRNQHKLSAARSELLTCSSPACPGDVRDECARRIADINAQLPTVVFEAKDQHDNDLSAVTLSMDGEQITERLDGTALAIDPGEHEFVFRIEDSQPVQKHFVIHEGEKNRRERVVLGAELPASKPEPQPVAIPAPKPPAEPVARSKPSAAPQPSEVDSTRRTAGIIVAAIGAAALGVALYQQVSARSSYSDSEHAAQSNDRAVRGTTHALYESAKHAQTSAIILASIGGVALASGAYLLITGLSAESQPDARSSVQLSPWLSPRAGGVSYEGRF